MPLKVEAGKVSSVIAIPPSKSYANRYLILGARRGKGISIANLPLATDVTTLVEALKKIGLKFTQLDGKLEFHNSFPACEHSKEKVIDLDVGEGGTTARFLLALLSTGRQKYRLKLAGRLGKRPWSELIQALQMADVSVSHTDESIEVQGPANLIKLPRLISAARSTQFASALQLAFHEDRIQFSVDNLQVSSPYWELTEACIDDIQHEEDLTVPLDWSSAAYPMCFAAVTNQMITLPGLEPDPEQADGVIFNILKSRGSVHETSTGIQVIGLTDKSPIQMDMRHCLDLTPAMAFLCAHLEGDSVLDGLEGLIHKESNRLQAIHQLLEAVGVKARLQQHRLVISGGLRPQVWHLSPPSDHRLVMAAALFLRAHRGGTVDHHECVNKSFPQFFELLGF